MYSEYLEGFRDVMSTTGQSLMATYKSEKSTLKIIPASYFSANTQLTSSSLVDSPEGVLEETELDGLVSVPGSEDVQIKDIPIVTALEGDEGMLYTKPISPGLVPDYYYTYLNSTCSSPETSMETSTVPTSKHFDHLYASLSRVDTSALLAENVHLKEMLVSHLDMIQQQQETIVCKDRLLKDVLEQKKLLLQKLARMERRVKPDGAPLCPSVPEQENKKRSSENQDDNKPTKKKKVMDNPRDKENTTPESVLPSRPKIISNLREVSSGVGTTDCPDDELTDEIIGDIEPALSVTNQEEKVESKKHIEIEKVKKERVASKSPAAAPPTPVAPPAPTPPPTATTSDKSAKQRRCRGGVTSNQPPSPLYTDHPYYVGCTNDKLMSTDDQLTEVPTLQRGVEVPCWREDKNHYTLLVQNKISLKKSKDSRETPTWRIKSTNPCYTMEASENTEDVTFLKRHEKMEKEEKKRKRWDLQQLREQQTLQKLRARQERQHAASRKPVEQELTSILPPLDAATHICVEDKIPVSAFGRPVPDLPRTLFSLPWYTESQ